MSERAKPAKPVGVKLKHLNWIDAGLPLISSIHLAEIWKILFAKQICLHRYEAIFHVDKKASTHCRNYWKTTRQVVVVFHSLNTGYSKRHECGLLRSSKTPFNTLNHLPGVLAVHIMRNYYLEFLTVNVWSMRIRGKTKRSELKR